MCASKPRRLQRPSWRWWQGSSWRLERPLDPHRIPHEFRIESSAAATDRKQRDPGNQGLNDPPASVEGHVRPLSL
jgi:hypothetical protein